MYGKKHGELDKSLEDPIKRGEEMARNLITEMECGVEITKDLTVLRPYKLAILGPVWHATNTMVFSVFLSISG